MKLRLSVLILFVIAVVRISAVPADPRPHTVRQSDGTLLTLQLRGDEHAHYYATADGIPVFRTERGFCYARMQQGSLAVTDMLAHDAADRSAAERQFVSARTSEVQQHLQQVRRECLSAADDYRVKTKKTTRSFSEPPVYRGEKKGLVILVNFANLTMQSGHTQQQFNRMLNEEGYSDNGCIGSVSDYFRDQSYGQFHLSFDVVGPVVMPENYGYYGRNSTVYGDDCNVREMVEAACRKANSRVNFRDYDWDGDGEVDQVYIIYAGYGESAGAPDNTIWPHKSILGSQAIELDGVRINTYACSCELAGNSGATLNGIGVICHEFSHCLGLPDIYDTDYSGGFGMGCWDVMSSGNYSGPEGNGEVPYGYSAYERWCLGWLEPEELTVTQHVASLPPLDSQPAAYVVYNGASRDEMYVIENHQATGWFSYLSTVSGIHGMMVTHVDFDAAVWDNNSVNNDPAHQRVAIIPADGVYGTGIDDYAGDLYPGLKKVQWLTDESHAAAGAALYNPNSDGSFLMHCSLGNISEQGGNVSFDVIFNDEVHAPAQITVTGADAGGYAIEWDPVAAATAYEVEQTCLVRTSGGLPKVFRASATVTEPRCRLSWLAEGGSTTVKVKAVAGGVKSAWSKPQSVSATSSAISPVEAEPGAGAGSPVYFTPDGVRHASPQPGVNIVRTRSGVRKVLVK